jgi:hypothetical protein
MSYQKKQKNNVLDLLIKIQSKPSTHSYLSG